MKRPSERGSSQEFDWLAEFDCSEREQVDEWSKLSAAERSAIERLDAEVWGLLPCMMDPVAPSSSCKEALLRRLASPASVSVMPQPETPRPFARRWMLPLAAGLALALVGYTSWTLSTIRTQRNQLAALQEVVLQMSSTTATSSTLRNEHAAMRDNLSLVSSRGVEICALRPTGGEAGAAAGQGPYGLLFLAADHQHWYVRVAGLEQQPGRYYRVWFETDDGLVPAGNLAGQELELASPTMPEGTRAVHVSIEDEPAPASPSDEIVLFGDDMIQVL